MVLTQFVLSWILLQQFRHLFWEFYTTYPFVFSIIVSQTPLFIIGLFQSQYFLCICVSLINILDPSSLSIAVVSLSYSFQQYVDHYWFGGKFGFFPLSFLENLMLMRQSLTRLPNPIEAKKLQVSFAVNMVIYNTYYCLNHALRIYIRKQQNRRASTVHLLLIIFL